MKKQRSVVSGQQSVAAVPAVGVLEHPDADGTVDLAFVGGRPVRIVNLPVAVPALGEVVQVWQVEEIALDLLVESPLNPRKTYDEKALNELAASIRSVGIKTPLLVRPKARPYFVSDSGFGDVGKVRYLACRNIVGHVNLVETFGAGTAEENQTDAEEAVAERNGKAEFELIAGRRRAEAARLVGLATAPCIVREMDDQEAAKIALIDNLMREGVDPLEEAGGFAVLLKDLLSVAAVAAAVGKEEAYVTRRLKLLTLTLNVRDALHLRLVTVDHALLLTKLGPDEQDEALKWCLDRNAGVKADCAEVVKGRAKQREEEQRGRNGRLSAYIWEPESVVRLKGHIESSSGRKLKTAPWSLDDAALIPDVGSCSACPSNTKANNLLFGDLDMDEATCTDGGCFEAKTKAFVQLKRVEATPEPKWTGGVSAETHERVSPKPDAPLSFSWKFSSVQPRWDKNTARLSLTQIFKAGQWVEAKKGSCEHARLGVATDWEDEANRGYMGNSRDKHRKPGAELLICIEPKCKAHPKAWEAQGQPNRAAKAAPVDAAEEKRRAEIVAVREKHELAIRNEVLAAVVLKLTPAAALRLLVDSQWNGIEARKQAKKDWPQASAEQLDCLVALDDELQDAFFGFEGVDLGTDGAVEAAREDAWGIAKKLGVDANGIAAAHFWRIGSMAPGADVLYPKGMPWPKDGKAGKQQTAAGGQPKKPAKKAAKAAPKKAAKKSVKKAVRK